MQVVIVTNAKNLALRYRRRLQKFDPKLLEAERKTMQFARREAIKLSSGHFYKIGVDSDYPYSTRDPHPPAPPHILNIQSGQLVKSWRTQTRKTRTGLTSILYNIAKNEYGDSYSRYMLGTSIMIPRPIMNFLIPIIRKERIKFFRQALREIINA